MTIEIEYNDEFDAEHYPIKDKHRDVAVKLIEMLYLPNPEYFGWWYDATIHGVIITIDYNNDASMNNRGGRLGVEALKALSELEGVRWIEANDREFKIGLEH